MNLTGPMSPKASRERLAAMVLAAGASSRMGRLKPLLRLAGITALARSIAVFQNAGIDEVLVVLGNRAEELRPVAERCGARCVHNARFEEGMYSSVVAGARALPHWAVGAFVLPADVPLVRPATVCQLSNAFRATPDAIAYPTFEGRRGHPPLIARGILDEAVINPKFDRLSALLLTHEANALDVPVPDEAIHLDMDTPADFQLLQALASGREIPTERECEAMLAKRHVQETVILHSRKVREIAGLMADALFEKGLAINPELARAGGLLHDLAKGEPQHAEAGAAILLASGMHQVAEVMAAHTEMEFRGTLDERAIVYLADKMVCGESLVSIDQRFERALKRFRDNPDALKAARRRKATAQFVARAIERTLGMPLFALFGADAPSRKRERVNAYAMGDRT